MRRHAAVRRAGVFAGLAIDWRDGKIVKKRGGRRRTMGKYLVHGCGAESVGPKEKAGEKADFNNTSEETASQAWRKNKARAEGSRQLKIYRISRL